MQSRNFFVSTVALSLSLCSYAAAQSLPVAQPQAQIVSPVDEAASVTLVGNVHPLVSAASSSKAADLGTPMQHMVITLNSSAAQEAALTQLVAAQNDPKSPSYHQYLTPQAYASMFGASQADIKAVTDWLQSHGFTVEQVPAGNRTVLFGGTAAQVNSAFKTQIRQYALAGANYYANATDPSIPAAFASAVGGVVKLHNFPHSPNITTKTAVKAAQISSPQYTSGSSHSLTPADYAVIYDINPLYSASIDGSGETIAILARSDISMSDVEHFRSTFGLKANNPQFIVTNSDPGIVSGDTVETTLDTEWSGAVAPNATIKVIISASSNSADGIDLSAIYAVNNNVAPVISLSYGSCELGMGSSELNFYNSLWKQAASQGQTVLVSSGDSGAAGCDYGSTAYYGKNVNGLCTSPYDTCVGGTEFEDTTNPGQYWLSSNSANLGSAISYIPEACRRQTGRTRCLHDCRAA
jgi:subtilase family serine protease